MATHGTPWMTMANMIGRARGRARVRKRKRRRIKNPEAYAAAVAANKRLGIGVQKRKIRGLTLRTGNKKISLPKLSFMGE